jgi:hypothetical protein
MASQTAERVPTAILHRLIQAQRKLDLGDSDDAREDIEDALAWARGELDASDFAVDRERVAA